MLQVGLTGGMASGKSTVAAILAGFGAVIIDADQVARDVVAVGAPGLAAVVGEFGPQVLQPGGALDRAALAEQVFDDDEALGRLNAIVHPLVRQAIAERICTLPSDAIVVQDVPLLVENEMASQFHLVVVVAASQTTRIQRAIKRGLPQSQVIARLAAQVDDQARRLAADAWIENEDSQENLREAVEVLWHARVVPFAENLSRSRYAMPGEMPVPPPSENKWRQRADRLIARIDRVADGSLAAVTVEPVRDTTQLELIELRSRATTEDLAADALLEAGFVKIRSRTFANADPGRPAVLRLAA